MDYKDTLNLPETKFPMKAKLAEREPKMLEFWDLNKIYHKMIESRKSGKKFILHDGPPYSNGPIHLGQAFNKILKDFVIKYKSLRGFYTPFVPGWDTHGLPNEIQAVKTFKLNPKELDPIEVRSLCKKSALHWLEIQKKQFQRLGVLGDWDKPYITLDPDYEAAILSMFRRMTDEGYIYRGLKPVFWCISCETALAEAEIEYKNKKSPSIIVKFKLKDSKKYFPHFDKPVYVTVWTTTPWTLPANTAVALNPKETYCLVGYGDQGLIMAESMADYVMDESGIEQYEIEESFSGKKLELAQVYHPFLDKLSLIINTDYVSMEQGTGCVHTAPGHGQEDYEAALLYSLPIVMPVNGEGYLDSQAGAFQGLHIKDADSAIIEHLEKSGCLHQNSEVEHSYPHCWRCRKPVIFRAVPQWFAAVDVNNLRSRVLEEIDRVKWIPRWGRDRIYNMVKDRPDWCISRQRMWGTPLPIFRCASCNQYILDCQVISHVEKIFQKEGSDAWFQKSEKELLPSDYQCSHCESEDLKKEYEIFDVWFESGVSYEGVCRRRDELSYPADLYLEGSDQHRGWFQLSLIPSMAVYDKAPFKEVLTHGWVLDETGKTMHKSLGNVVDPLEVVEKHGAEILRLFVSSTDYTSDVKIGDNQLKQTGEVYRKLRNTARFMLSNLFDFDPDLHKVPYEKLLPLDAWILYRVEKLTGKIIECYDNYQFHQVYRYLHNFCIRELSQFYLDIQKDVLYADAPDSIRRRSAQTAFYHVLKRITLTSAPLITFTAEEIWQNYEPFRREYSSVLLACLEDGNMFYLDPTSIARWEIMLELKNQISRRIEWEREKKTLKGAAESKVDLYAGGRVLDALSGNEELFKEIIRVPLLQIHRDYKSPPKNAVPSEGFPQTYYTVSRFEGVKCPRCWNHYSQLVKDNLCQRCSIVLKNKAKETQGV